MIEKCSSSDKNNNAKEFDEVISSTVNIIVSYDMGWSKRGNGRSYDSLNGYGAIIGFLTGKILDYRTRNRKCHLCDLGRQKIDHDCRRNFSGSAKAMEADAGAELVNRSDILKDLDLNVKVIVGDEDSSLMAAVNKENTQKNNGRKIFKLSDRNHVKKNLSKKLYNLRSQCKELTKKGVISHIKKCFSYAVAQNKGNAVGLSAAVRCIPDHMYNAHENCGTWCKKKSGTNPGIYNQKFILKSEQLYQELKQIFSIYADNASKYCVSASSQTNESFNNIVSHKFPKNKNYSTSPSGDVRVASAVLSKNEGDSYLVEVKQSLNVPMSSNLNKFCQVTDNNRFRRAEKTKNVETKTRRIELVQKREKLRKNLENKEGITYSSNIAFELDANLKMFNDIVPLSSENCKVVYFDLETSGRDNKADILQIAAIVEDNIFSVYIEPTQPIDENASKINGLQNVEGDLYLRGRKLMTLNIIDALQSFITFFKQFSGTSLLTAHNASFDERFLIRDIMKYSLVSEFSQVVYGFCDTLKLFRVKYPDRKGKGMLTLSKLSQDLLNFEVESENFHEATYDVIILQKLGNENFTNTLMLENAKKFNESLKSAINKCTNNKKTKAESQRKIVCKKNVKQNVESFKLLKGEISNYMIRKLLNKFK